MSRPSSPVQAGRRKSSKTWGRSQSYPSSMPKSWGGSRQSSAPRHDRAPAVAWPPHGLEPITMSNPLESWTEEQRSAFLYRACADAEAGTPRGELFMRLGGEAEAQAAIWRAQLTASGKPAPPPFVPDFRARLVVRLIKLF